MKQIELIRFGENALKQENIQDAGIKARMLLQHILNQTRQEIIINSEKIVNQNQIDEYEKSINKIINGLPIQYITHNQQFMGLEFYVDENVLIPQPDTEVLVEQTIKIINQLSKNGKKVEVLDLCTGSGAIAISIGHYCNDLEITATDISLKALEITKKNAKTNEVINLEILKSDLFNELSEKKFDVIVSNPPYIETETIKKLSKDLQAEPHIALDGGKDGLEFYRKILNESHKYLRPNGYLLLEIGYNQGKIVTKLECNNLKLITNEPIKDFEGNNRVVVFQKEG